MHHWPWERGEYAFISGTDFFDHSFRILYQLPWHHWLSFLLHSRVIIDLKESLREREKSGFDNKKHYGIQLAFSFAYVYKLFLLSFFFYSWGNRVLPRLDGKATVFAVQPVFCITNAQIGRHSGKKHVCLSDSLDWLIGGCRVAECCILSKLTMLRFWKICGFL